MQRCWRYPACLVLLLFAMRVTSAEQTLDEPLISRGATVLLFPGLAGDLESERTYNEQLKSLVQLADQSSAGKLLVFLDQAEDLTSPRLQPQRFQASRADFLKAAAQLPPSTNPLVAIVWGHGGTQGQTPVFHVRGPRIMPA